MTMLPLVGAQFYDVPVYNAQVPKEGPKAVAVTAPFDGGTTPSFDVNLFLTQSQQYMSMVQAFFCDNSDNPNDVFVTPSVINQRIRIPPQCQCYLPILCPKNAVINLASNGQANVQFIFVNIPLPGFLWPPGVFQFNP